MNRTAADLGVIFDELLRFSFGEEHIAYVLKYYFIFAKMNKNISLTKKNISINNIITHMI